jgi:uncharacterized C2H2 Zn-finger protein
MSFATRCPVGSCGFEAPSVSSYVQHVKIHDGQKTLFIPCPFPDCPFKYRWSYHLNRHVNDAHCSGQKKKTIYRQDEEAVFQCVMNSCFNKTVTSIRELKTHLLGHTDLKEWVQCPFKTCVKRYNVRTSLFSHFERCHKRATVLDVSNNSSSVETRDISFIDSNIQDNCGVTVEDSDDSDFEAECLTEGLVGAVGDFYNCLMNEKKVPHYTTDFIVEKMTALHEQNMKLVEKAVKDLFVKSDSPLDASQVISEMRRSDLLAGIHSKSADANMSTEYGRLKFIDNHMLVVPPVTVVLNPSDPPKKQKTFQYVSIRESLKLILQDSSYQNCATSARTTPSNMYSDIWDSDVYKENPFFMQNPTAIPLILYSDEIAITNPLSATTSKKHKMIMMYYTLGTIPSWNRTKVDSMQLVLAMRSEDYGIYKQNICYRKVVDELKSLETDGIDINGQKQLVGLLFYAADNLEAHSVGGFSLTFNHGSICRTCDIQHSDLGKGRVHDFSDPGLYPPFTQLSEEHYDELANDENNSWVRHTSIFNELQSFHASKQFAPCLGHDLLEGVISYDLHGLLKIMIQKRGWFSLDKINNKIAQFKFPSKDKPNPLVLVNRLKLSGSAAQMWNLIRFLPSILVDLVPNLNDPVHKLVIQLHNLAEMCTSVSLTIAEIAHMDVMSQEYLNHRQDLVADENLISPKPKHHFISHYAFLYKRFGPLIFCWTLRFESKHRYFKDLANKSKNFINFLKTASTRHQRFQAHLLHCGFFKPDFVVPDNAVTLQKLISENKSQTTLTQNIFSLAKTVSTNPFISNSVVFRGTRYTCDKFVVLHSDPDNFQIHVGKILKCVISTTGTVVYLVVRMYVGENSGRGFFYIENRSDLRLVCLSDLADYVPLNVLPDTRTLVLHHYISNRQQ